MQGQECCTSAEESIHAHVPRSAMQFKLTFPIRDMHSGLWVSVLSSHTEVDNMNVYLKRRIRKIISDIVRNGIDCSLLERRIVLSGSLWAWYREILSPFHE